MEQIYTIPVNETFDECRNDKSLGCPFCRLYKKLEANEVNLILGASMMEPDVRQKTNEAGFCTDHWKKLLSAGKRLPLSLIIQSHLGEIDHMMKKPGLLPAISGADSARQLGDMSCDCYICRRIDANFERMVETAALLWEADDSFKEKLDAQQGFCITHFARLVKEAKGVLKAKSFSEFYKAVYKKESEYLSNVRDSIDAFAKKFDYRYANEAWNGEENAVEKAVELICGNEKPL